MQSLLNQPVVLSLQSGADGGERNIHGNISRMKLLELGSDGMAAYETEMVPWFWFLTLFSDCRIFQNMTVPDIVEAGLPGPRLHRFQIAPDKSTYNPRDYCVQYRETDFNFVSRLLEEEGIFYFFEHTPRQAHAGAGGRCQRLCRVPEPARRPLFMRPPRAGTLDDDVVFTLEAECRVNTGTASLNDYDFTKPNTSLFTTLASKQPGKPTIIPESIPPWTMADRYARDPAGGVGSRHLHGARRKQLHGLRRAAIKFTLSGYYRDSANIDYSLLIGGAPRAAMPVTTPARS